MKVAVTLLALVALGASVPQPRKFFHEHFEDFVDIIAQEAGEQLEELNNQYIQFEEFQRTIDFILTTNFKDLIYEMESLPEFKAVIEFLENDNIDILYFLDRFNELLESTKRRSVSSRIEVSGTDMSSFISDTISLFPKEKLAALFEQKMAEDEEFRVAVENLESEEWQNIVGALFANEVFQNEMATLGQNGIQVHLLLTEVAAIFGQN